jgi:hypothetical protein
MNRNFTQRILSVVLLSAAALCAEVGFGNVPERTIELSISEGRHGSHHVEGRFETPASSEAAWDVLTAYDDLASVVSSITSSRTVSRDDHRRTVEQVMSGKAGFFRKRIYLLLQIQESPTKITFEDVSGKSFKSYSGTWEVVDGTEGVEVRYTLNATPAFYAPDFMTVRAFKRNVEQLLTQVRSAIEDRHARLATSSQR